MRPKTKGRVVKGGHPKGVRKAQRTARRFKKIILVEGGRVAIFFLSPSSSAMKTVALVRLAMMRQTRSKGGRRREMGGKRKKKEAPS